MAANTPQQHLRRLAGRAAPIADRAARGAIRHTRTLLDRVERRLDRRLPAADLPAGPTPPAGEEESHRRWWSLLSDVDARGGRMSAEEFRSLAEQHGYEARGIGGFFSGNSTMRRDGDVVELTPRGRREVQYWAPTFRDHGSDG
jgi:hypothetical protein